MEISAVSAFCNSFIILAPGGRQSEFSLQSLAVLALTCCARFLNQQIKHEYTGCLATTPATVSTGGRVERLPEYLRDPKLPLFFWLTTPPRKVNSTTNASRRLLPTWRKSCRSSQA